MSPAEPLPRNSLLPPKPWVIELLGLAEAVTFTHPDGRSLIWTPEGWMVGRGRTARPAPGVPAAATMTEARRVGCEWLHKIEGA